MEILLIASLVPVIFIVVLSFFINKYAEFWYRVLIVNRLSLINSIILTEEIPDSWRVPVLDKAARHGRSTLGVMIRPLLSKWYLYRLDALSKSIRISSFIKEDEKDEFLEAFAQIRSDWVSQLESERHDL